MHKKTEKKTRHFVRFSQVPKVCMYVYKIILTTVKHAKKTETKAVFFVVVFVWRSREKMQTTNPLRKTTQHKDMTKI